MTGCKGDPPLSPIRPSSTPSIDVPFHYSMKLDLCRRNSLDAGDHTAAETAKSKLHPMHACRRTRHDVTPYIACYCNHSRASTLRQQPRTFEEESRRFGDRNHWKRHFPVMLPLEPNLHDSCAALFDGPSVRILKTTSQWQADLLVCRRIASKDCGSSERSTTQLARQTTAHWKPKHIDNGGALQCILGVAYRRI